uniref:Reverse transcriptase domain-containing protein n=1 Tax=Rhodnius prolixus TaxID=13249 RepID=T1I8U0_RHOPR
MIKDHIIAHVNDAEAQQNLLKQTKEQSLEEIIALCRAAEMGKTYKREISNNNNNNELTSEVNYTRKFANKQTKKIKHKLQNTDVKYYDCKKCGTKHKPRSCPAFKKTCSFCKRQNHFEVGCFLKNRKKSVYEVETSSRNPITFKLDSASDVNILPLNIYNNLQDTSKIEKTNVRLRSYGGFTTNPIGIGKLPFKIKIKLRDEAIPVVKRTRRIPEFLKKKLKNELDRLVKLEIIRQTDEPTDW